MRIFLDFLRVRTGQKWNDLSVCQTCHKICIGRFWWAYFDIVLLIWDLQSLISVMSFLYTDALFDLHHANRITLKATSFDVAVDRLTYPFTMAMKKAYIPTGHTTLYEFGDKRRYLICIKGFKLLVMWNAIEYFPVVYPCHTYALHFTRAIFYDHFIHE